MMIGSVGYVGKECESVVHMLRPAIHKDWALNRLSFFWLSG